MTTQKQFDRIPALSSYTPPQPAEHKIHRIEGVMLPTVVKGNTVEEPYTIIVEIDHARDTVSKALEKFPSLKPSNPVELNAKCAVYTARIAGTDGILFDLIPIDASQQITTVQRLEKLKKINTTSLRQPSRYAQLTHQIFSDALTTITRCDLPIHYRVACSQLFSREFQEKLKKVSYQYDSVQINDPLSAVEYWSHVFYVMYDLAYLHSIAKEPEKQQDMLNMIPKMLDRFGQKIISAISLEGVDHIDTVDQLSNFFLERYLEYKPLRPSSTDNMILNTSQIFNQIQETVSSSSVSGKKLQLPTAVDESKGKYPQFISFLNFCEYFEKEARIDKDFVAKFSVVLCNASEDAPYQKSSLLSLLRNAESLKPEFFQEAGLERNTFPNMTQVQIAGLLVSAALHETGLADEQDNDLVPQVNYENEDDDNESDDQDSDFDESEEVEEVEEIDSTNQDDETSEVVTIDVPTELETVDPEPTEVTESPEVVEVQQNNSNESQHQEQVSETTTTTEKPRRKK